jgi:hypothetical protein
MDPEATSVNADYEAILDAFDQGQSRALRSVHAAMIETYLAIGAILSRRTGKDKWTENGIQTLSEWLIRNTSSATTFTARNLGRMRRFNEVWNGKPELLPQLCELSWSCHLVLLERCRSDRERKFYLLAALNGKWTRKELQSRIPKHQDRSDAPADD